MANRPDEDLLTSGEKLAIAIACTAFVSLLVTVVLLVCLSWLGPRPTAPMVVAAWVLGLAAGALWVQPWNPNPPPRK